MMACYSCLVVVTYITDNLVVFFHTFPQNTSPHPHQPDRAGGGVVVGTNTQIASEHGYCLSNSD